MFSQAARERVVVVVVGVVVVLLVLLLLTNTEDRSSARAHFATKQVILSITTGCGTELSDDNALFHNDVSLFAHPICYAHIV